MVLPRACTALKGCRSRLWREQGLGPITRSGDTPEPPSFVDLELAAIIFVIKSGWVREGVPPGRSARRQPRSRSDLHRLRRSLHLLADVRVEPTLAEADRLRRYLDELVVGDVAHSALERHA